MKKQNWDKMGQLCNCAENPTLIPNVIICSLRTFFWCLSGRQSRLCTKIWKSTVHTVTNYTAYHCVAQTQIMIGLLFLCQMIAWILTFALSSGQNSSANYFAIYDETFYIFKTTVLYIYIFFSGDSYAEELGTSLEPF